MEELTPALGACSALAVASEPPLNTFHFGNSTATLPTAHSAEFQNEAQKHQVKQYHKRYLLHV
jgi:hypothetical protein